MDLGKWPRMVVVGDPVTPGQADNILVRTMNWTEMCCNDEDWLAEVRSIMAEFGMPVEPLRTDFDSHAAFFASWAREWRPAHERFCKRHRFLPWLSLDKLANDRILSTSLGWCSWSGVIGCERNIGKWPSRGEVAKGWAQIARAFPFLNLVAELTPECGDHSGAVRFTVTGGKLTVRDSGSEKPLEPAQDWLRERHGVEPFDERGVTAERLRQALRTALA